MTFVTMLGQDGFDLVIKRDFVGAGSCLRDGRNENTEHKTAAEAKDITLKGHKQYVMCLSGEEDSNGNARWILEGTSKKSAYDGSWPSGRWVVGRAIITASRNYLPPWTAPPHPPVEP